MILVQGYMLTYVNSTFLPTLLSSLTPTDPRLLASAPGAPSLSISWLSGSKCIVQIGLRFCLRFVREVFQT